MNRIELAAAVAEKTGLSCSDSEKAIKAFMESVTEALAKGDGVQLIGFGSFSVKDRPARTGHNPITNEPMEIAAARLPVFKAGTALKKAVK